MMSYKYLLSMKECDSVFPGLRDMEHNPTRQQLVAEGATIYDENGKDTTQHMYGGYPDYEGSGNPNWKGGITSDWKAYLAEWHQKNRERRLVAQRERYRRLKSENCNL